jgi:hypothetical protein
MANVDPRITAFCSPQGPEIFHSVEHRHELHRHDPFDVESVHADARDVFHRALSRATTPPGLPSGRILLILGESGSGKTHLLRAFRSAAHRRGTGFVGYMQMTTATSDYGRYMLGNLIDSLDLPYNEEVNEMHSGLARLSRAVAGRCLDKSRLKLLQDPETLDQDDLDTFVNDAADALITSKPDFADVDLDLVRVLLYLQREDPRIKARALKYLRCEPLSKSDAAFLGGIAPRIHDDDPGRLVEALGKLVGKLNHSALILCMDQLEDVWNMDAAVDRFRKAMSAVVAFADRIPSSIFVVCCLQDFYDGMKERLTRSIRDRLDLDPEPVLLRSERSVDEVSAILHARLNHLYETQRVPTGDDAPLVDPTFPIPRELIATWSKLRTRDVLEQARSFRERAIKEGKLPSAPPAVESATPVISSPKPALGYLHLQQAWNDFRSTFRGARPQDDESLALLMAWAIERCSEELESHVRFSATSLGESIDVEQHASGKVTERVRVAICNKSTRGGHLANQIDQLAASIKGAKKGTTLALIRSTEFPSEPKAKAAIALGKAIAAGGRRAVIEDAEILTMCALQEFRKERGSDAAFATWLAYENPLSRLQVLRLALALDAIEPAGSTPSNAQLKLPIPSVPPPAPVETAPTPTPPSAATTTTRSPPPRPSSAPPPRTIHLGASEGLLGTPLTMATDELCAHAAFLGSTGSGKTTLAVNVIEQLLLDGIPVVVVDRKGDLAGYAKPSAWNQRLNDASREARRRALHEVVDPVLYTPGNSSGRALGVSVVPAGLETLDASDREDEAAQAADAIAGMLDYKVTGRDKACRAVLKQAVQLLAQTGHSITLTSLIELLDQKDHALLAAVGKLDDKHFEKLVQDLETFRITNEKLLDESGPTLDIEALFGVGAHEKAGKTRLSIISTKFLGSDASILFWVAQLLMRLTRWANKTPSPKLRAAILFDEADMYLPAMSQPATKQPMENLLRRARSAGLGVLLATQSPGDLDYRCRDNIRTWMVGRIAQTVAIQKMKPLLSESRVDVSGRLATRQIGQFFVLRQGNATGIRGRLPVMMPEQLPETELLELARG